MRLRWRSRAYPALAHLRNPQGARDRTDTTPSPRNASTPSWSLPVGSPPLKGITLAPAGSTQPSEGGALALTLSLGLGLIKARPPTKGCVFLIYSHHITFENQNLQAITQEIIIKSFVHFY